MVNDVSLSIPKNLITAVISPFRATSMAPKRALPFNPDLFLPKGRRRKRHTILPSTEPP